MIVCVAQTASSQLETSEKVTCGLTFCTRFDCWNSWRKKKVKLRWQSFDDRIKGRSWIYVNCCNHDMESFIHPQKMLSHFEGKSTSFIKQMILFFCLEINQISLYSSYSLYGQNKTTRRRYWPAVQNCVRHFYYFLTFYTLNGLKRFWKQTQSSLRETIQPSLSSQGWTV